MFLQIGFQFPDWWENFHFIKIQLSFQLLDNYNNYGYIVFYLLIR